MLNDDDLQLAAGLLPADRPIHVDPQPSFKETVPVLMRLYAQPTPAFAAGPVALGKALTMLRATCAAAGRRLQAGQGTWGQALATRMNSLGGGLARASVALQTITSPNPGPRRKPECRRS